MNDIVLSLECWNNYLYAHELHNNTVAIEAIENPGWWVRIDLSNTDFKNIGFIPIITNIDRSSGGETDSQNWLSCYIENNIFNGAGSINKLSKIFEIFFNWLSENGYCELEYKNIDFGEPSVPVGGFNIWKFCIKNGYKPIINKY